MTTVAGLSLYHYETCPFCHRVRHAAERLGIELELRDIITNRQHLQDLTAARGRRTVPVLRIDDESGTRWLPESADIVRYLQERFGEAQTGT